MAKASGSKSSRSERKAGRQRAERARAHGLPELRPVQAAASVAPDEDAAVERADVTPAAAAAARKGRPVLVWVLGAALVILLIAYVITRFRDSASP